MPSGPSKASQGVNRLVQSEMAASSPGCMSSRKATRPPSKCPKPRGFKKGVGRILRMQTRYGGPTNSLPCHRRLLFFSSNAPIEFLQKNASGHQKFITRDCKVLNNYSANTIVYGSAAFISTSIQPAASSSRRNCSTVKSLK